MLINVLDPSDQQHTDSTRLTALRILKSALEQSGSAILNFPSLEALIVDPGCKFLFLLARSDNSSVLQLALRTISTMFDCLRKKLKLQQELFLAFTMDRLAPPIIPGGKNKALQSAAAKRSNTSSPRPGTPGTPMLPPPENDQGEKSAPTRILVTPARGETRDLVLETLSLFSRYPSFMVDLFVNYDCDINCENLFERLLEFLTKVQTLPHCDQSLWADILIVCVPFRGCLFRNPAAERAIPLPRDAACVRQRYGFSSDRGWC